MGLLGNLEGGALATGLNVGRGFLDKALGYEWGLYFKDKDTGALKPLFPQARITGMGMTASANAAQTPLEDGGFQSYNKIRKPESWTLNLVFMRDPLRTAGNQGKVLGKLEKQLENASILFLKQPGHTSSTVTLVGYDYKREARSGCDLLIVNLTLQEVRSTGKKVIQHKDGTFAEKQNMGHVEPIPRK
ncbi:MULTISPECIES: phage baseplate protein [unclassified Saccharibacter]|uniref:phage baseplate protein n=1 Tax=unclassified Saccharibacter TaxID=2648722 RepID=UPI001323EE5E|nr:MULTISPECIES: hypothetical protein [unclassified Saccharibacter]MXV35669.1 hypothetical protein [Saccharibacter sp. EH611]MXV58283.1 hypothetical protein [Saccharibacter sp. EH70]MXV66420.1 hypothetical protein [Saccharibacter sp. EH60]